MENSEGFNPSERVELQRVITEAVTAALSAYVLGREGSARRTRAPFIISPNRLGEPAEWFNPAEEWRKAASLRYAAGTWKRSLTEVIPFQRFRASELVRESGERLQAEHPTHHHIRPAVANTLKWLVDDGVIAKLGRGMYAPAIDGDPVV